MGYSRKKQKTRAPGIDWGHPFLKTSLDFLVFHFAPGNYGQNKGSLQETSQIWLHPRKC